MVSGVLKDKQAVSGLQKACRPRTPHHGVFAHRGRAEPLRWPFIGEVPGANVFGSVFDRLAVGNFDFAVVIETVGNANESIRTPTPLDTPCPSYHASASRS